MAVKPILNRQVVSSKNIKREEQISQRNTSAKVGNREQTFVPGLNFDKNYAITLKDVDSAVLTHVKDVMRPTIKEAGEQVKVTVMYGNEERWKSARKRGIVRDKKGSLILPLVILKRTAVERNAELPGYESDVRREHVQVVRHSTWSKHNRYDNFSVQTGKKPLIENYVTTVPNFVNITYEFILWTNYIEQMNYLVEGFIEQNNNYWGNSSNYKFLCSLDSVSDASEMTVDSERVVKSTFSLTTKAYLLPEETNSVVTNRIAQLQKKLSPTKVVFGSESDATDNQINPQPPVK